MILQASTTTKIEEQGIPLKTLTISADVSPLSATESA